MKKIIFLFVATSFYLTPTNALAQSATDTLQQTDTPLSVQPVEIKISSDDVIRVGKKAIFGISPSPIAGSGASFVWNFGDGSREEKGEEAVHGFSKLGNYNVVLSIFDSSTTTPRKISKEIFVFSKRALLVTDPEKKEELNSIIEESKTGGVALKVISLAGSEGSFVNEDSLVSILNENSDYIKDSDALIFYTKTSIGLQAFSRFLRDSKLPDKDAIRSKLFVKVTDGSIDVAAPTTFQAYETIGSPFILLTRPEALGPLFKTADYSTLVDVLRARGIEYKIIDERSERSPWFFLSHLTTFFVSKGVSANTIYLILMIPFLALFTVFARQVIGINTFGVYAPVMTTASFYILGLKFGLFTFLLVVLISYTAKYILNKFELLYLPKVGLSLSIISLGLLISSWALLYFGQNISLSLAVFPMLLMTTVAEKFMAAQTEEGIKNAVLGVISTLLVVTASYYIISYVQFTNIVLSWPEFVIAPLILTGLLGKFTGLRLGEYLRFRSLFSEHTEE